MQPLICLPTLLYISAACNLADSQCWTDVRCADVHDCVAIISSRSCGGRGPVVLCLRLCANGCLSLYVRWWIIYYFPMQCICNISYVSCACVCVKTNTVGAIHMSKSMMIRWPWFLRLSLGHQSLSVSQWLRNLCFFWLTLRISQG